MDRDSALADGGGHPLHGSVSDVPNRENGTSTTCDPKTGRPQPQSQRPLILRPEQSPPFPCSASQIGLA